MSSGGDLLTAGTYRVFLSDLHGQGDVFEYLARQKFGIMEALILDLAAGNLSRELVFRHYLLSGASESETSFSGAAEVSAMMDLLLHFKNERRFWPVCVEVFSSCSWVLAVIDHCAIQDNVSENDLEAILLLEVQDRIRLCNLIAESVKRLVNYRLQVVGDIYDRGPNAAEILDQLETLPSVSIQWGNHDVLWMGAASGSLECIATVVRLCVRYGHTETLTKDYGIDLNTLADFAKTVYADDPCENFVPLSEASDWPAQMLAAMHKAISIIQFKLEHHIIDRNPDFAMEDRLLLRQIDFARGEIRLGNETVDLTDKLFPTVNPSSPSALTDDEWAVVDNLKKQFVHSERLQRHIQYLFANGSLVEADGEYLLFHGCMPVDENQQFMPVVIGGRSLTGRALMDAFELQLRKAHSRRYSSSCKYLSDIAWYLWCGPNSPLFGKQKMTTFERYFIADKRFHKEGKNPYFDLRGDSEFVAKVAEELSGNPDSIIINGHVPVKLKDGESPKHADGQLFCIDGGFSHAYRSRTGAAGMVLVANHQSQHLFLLSEKGQVFQMREI